MTTPHHDEQQSNGCPTPGCRFGRLHTGLCRNARGTALVAQTSPGATAPIPTVGIYQPTPAPAELVPYTPAQQHADLRESLQIACNCGQTAGHMVGCPRRVEAVHAEIAASIARGEIDAPATLGTPMDGLLYIWKGALLGYTVHSTGLAPRDGITLAHRCGHEISQPGALRLPELVDAAVAHHRECAR